MSDEEYINEEVDEATEHEEHHHKHLDHYDEYLEAQKITFQDVKEHIAGPIISLVIHIAMVAILWNVVVFEPGKQKDEIEVEVSEVEMKELEEIPEPPEPPEEVVEETVDIDIESPTVNTETNVDVESAVSDMAVEDVSVDVDIPDVLTVQETQSALKLPKTFSARVGTARQKALRKYGGGAHTEKAVTKALDWLKRNQNEDGSWGKAKANMPVFTATALLAFLARGETPMSAEYGQTIIKAIKKLLEWSDDMERYKRRYIPGPTYTHPIIVYALAEAYGITKMGKVKHALDVTIKPLIEFIDRDGFYYYGYNNRIYERWPRDYRRDPFTGRYPLPKPKKIEWIHQDLTFSCWNYQALKAAYAAGCQAPGIEATIQKAVKGLKKSSNLDKKNDFTYVCLRALCLGLLGEGRSKEAKALKKYIKDFNKKQISVCNWKYDKEIMKVYPRTFKWALYTWYYQTQVLFQISKGKTGLWSRWNSSFSRNYVREQEKDGSYLSPAQKYGKNFLKPGTAAEWYQVASFKDDLDLRLYCTTFACLSLEVYYRYLPTYKLGREKKKKKASFDDDLELGIE
jgi:hypothetical protein